MTLRRYHCQSCDEVNDLFDDEVQGLSCCDAPLPVIVHTVVPVMGLTVYYHSRHRRFDSFESRDIASSQRIKETEHEKRFEDYQRQTRK